MMELDDMKAAWGELDRRLDAGLAIQRRILTELRLHTTQSAMRRLVAVLAFELVSGAIATLLIGSFLGDHRDSARFAIPAVILLAATVLTITAGARQLYLVNRIDYSAPVVAIQRQIAELRTERVRITRRLLLASPLLWTPLAIVAAKACLGLDLYEVGPLWLASNTAVGVAVPLLAVWISRRHSDWLGRSPGFKLVADSFAGDSLARATASLDEIARFEEEK